MKTITLTLFEFTELNEQAKKKALNELSNINVDYPWWEAIYEDAKNIGLEITGFTIDDGRENATGKILNTMLVTMMAICDEHGKETDTYKLANQYLEERATLLKKETIQHLDKDFESRLLTAYAHMAKKEYEYRLTDKAIIETIESNEYTFEENGKLNNGTGKEAKILLTIDGGIVQSVATNFDAQVVTVDFDDIGDEPVVVTGPNKQDILVPIGKLFYEEMCKEESDMTKDEKEAKKRLKDINF